MGFKTKKTITSRYASTRAFYDPEVIYPILDEALFCTISYSEDNTPYSIPQSFVRVNDTIFIHASIGSHFLRTLADGRPICISIMLADDLVIAKSAFNHSVNYRSVVIFSKGEVINDPKQKADFFKILTDKMVPNSWDYLRPMTDKEVEKTMLIAFKIEEASAKIREGEPSDEDNEKDLPIWTGLIPIKPLRQAPITSQESKDLNLPIPKHLK